MADDTHCNGSYHKTHVTAMGFCMVRGPQGEGLAYPHPNAVTQACKLQQDPCLKTPKCQHAGYVPAILTGTLAASVPRCQTWGAQVLSIFACCQVAIMSGARWAHSAIQWASSMTPHASDDTAGYIHQQIQHFPRQRCCHVVAILKWLKKHAFRKRSQYYNSPPGSSLNNCLPMELQVPGAMTYPGSYIYRIPPRVNRLPPSPLNVALSHHA